MPRFDTDLIFSMPRFDINPTFSIPMAKWLSLLAVAVVVVAHGWARACGNHWRLPRGGGAHVWKGDRTVHF